MGKNENKRRHNYVRTMAKWSIAALIEQEELRFFFALKRWRWLIREAVKSRYHKPQGKKWDVKHQKKP